MSVLSDREILARCLNLNVPPMINPAFSQAIREVNGRKVISYGVSAYGYDIRVADEFKLYKKSSRPDSQVIDPKTPNEYFWEFKGDSVEIPPNSMMLCKSVEYFRMPRDIMCIAVGKSTYARCGIIANITPLEAGWEGVLTIELSNTTPHPVKVYANEGIAQLIFFRADSHCEISYADKGGKYQGQLGITEAIV